MEQACRTAHRRTRRLQPRRAIGLSGPTVALQAAQAVPISLIIHELATNAVKHGALSVAEGTLALAWRIEEGGLARRLVLTWTERNGPPVKPPERRGFGTRLIQDGLARELGGEIVLDYRPEGMSASLIIPSPDSRSLSAGSSLRPHPGDTIQRLTTKFYRPLRSLVFNSGYPGAGPCVSFL